MGSDTKKPRVACVEDCDSDEQAVRGSKRSAKAKDKSKSERHSRTHRSEGTSQQSSQIVTVGSDKSSSPTKSKRVDAVKEQTEREGRRRSISGTSTAQTSRQSSSRPSLHRAHVTSPPQLEIPSRPKADPSYYGISPGTTYTPNSSIRTSARPLSYYEGMPVPVTTQAGPVSRPPMARSAYYMSPPGPVPSVPTSYPMPSPSESYMRYAAPSADSYFAPSPSRTNPLIERFNRNKDPISRTTSAQGMRFSESYSNQMSDSGRLGSIRRNSKEAEDIMRMPPPPAGPIRRPSRVVDSRDLVEAYSAEVFDNEPSYEPRSARSTFQDPYVASRTARRPSVGRSSTYDYGKENGHYRIETSNKGRRRSSYYEDRSPQGSNYEEKLKAATGYQNEVAGEPVSLTREALRKQERTTASSRSTRSNSSRDESDFKRSATTRTTTSRIEGEGDDITIRVKGTATVKIGAAEINCNDGTELNLTRSKSIRNGSERSESEYGRIAPYDYRSSRDRRTIIDSRSTAKSGHSNPLPIRYRDDWF